MKLRTISACALMLVSASISEATMYFYGQSFNLAIPSPDDARSEFGKGAMKTAEFFVGEHRTIHDLNVYIGITHGCFSDLEITLVSPAGRKVVLSEWGNTGLLKSGGKKLLIFDDQAAVTIMGTKQLVSGNSYKPAALLSALNNTDTYGTWKIKISDHIYDSSGTLDYVRLAVSNPEPATLGLLTMGLVILRGKRHI